MTSTESRVPNREDWDDILGVPLHHASDDAPLDADCNTDWQDELNELTDAHEGDVAANEVFVSGADAEQLIEQDGVFYTDQNDDHILEGLDVQESSIAKANALTMRPNGETKEGTYFISPDIPMSPGAYFAQYSAPLEKEAMIREFPSFASPTAKNHRNYLPSFEEASLLAETPRHKPARSSKATRTFAEPKNAPNTKLNVETKSTDAIPLEIRLPAPSSITFPSWSAHHMDDKHTSQIESWHKLTQNGIEEEAANNHPCQCIQVTLVNPSCRPCCVMVRDTLKSRVHFHYEQNKHASANYFQFDNNGIEPVEICVDVQVDQLAMQRELGSISTDVNISSFNNAVQIEAEPCRIVVAPGDSRFVTLRHVVTSSLLKSVKSVSFTTSRIRVMARGGGGLSLSGKKRKEWMVGQLFTGAMVLDATRKRSTNSREKLSSFSMPFSPFLNKVNRARNSSKVQAVNQEANNNPTNSRFSDDSRSPTKKSGGYSTSNQIGLPHKVSLKYFQGTSGEIECCVGKFTIRNNSTTESQIVKAMGEPVNGFQIPSIVSWELVIPPNEATTVELSGRFVGNKSGSELQARVASGSLESVGKVFILGSNYSGWIPVTVSLGRRGSNATESRNPKSKVCLNPTHLSPFIHADRTMKSSSQQPIARKYSSNRSISSKQGTEPTSSSHARGTKLEACKRESRMANSYTPFKKSSTTQRKTSTNSTRHMNQISEQHKSMMNQNPKYTVVTRPTTAKLREPNSVLSPFVRARF